jgi:protein-disulfide isomerase
MPQSLTTRRQLLLTGAAIALLTGLGIPARAQTEDAADAAGADDRSIVEMTMGDPDAPVTVIEYASLTCPHCAVFHRDVLPRIREEFIETGQVHYIMREVYFDRPGLWGSMLARCAGEDRYFGVLDLLFAGQSEWTSAADPAQIVENLYGIGRQAGLTREGMDACFQDSDFARALVGWYQENATEHEIQGTPSFVINGERTGNLPWTEFRARIEAALSD